MKIPLLIMTTMFFFQSSVSYAQFDGQTFDPTSPDAASVIREAHLNSQSLPDGIVFIENARVIAHLASTDFEHEVNVLSEASGLSENQAAQAVRLSIDALTAFKAETELQQRRMACTESKAPKVYGDDVYKVLEQIDDMHESIAQKHLDGVLRKLGKDAGDLFTQWLDIRKFDTQYVKFDYKKAYERVGESGDVVLASICLTQ